MTDVKDKTDNVDSLSCRNNEFRKESIDEETKNVSEWSIIYFESDEEDNVESFNDLIPTTWITKEGSLCQYPMYEHKSTIQKLVKRCARANTSWNYFKIKKIEQGIGKFLKNVFNIIQFVYTISTV